MHLKSSEVQSPQTGPHARLVEVVQSHLQHADQTPIAPHSLQDWPMLHEFLRSQSRFVLDLGCGTGLSTERLASRVQQTAVLGVDRSVDRLSRVADLPSHARIARFDQYDLLRLCRQDGLLAEKVYLLYPNPSPKPDHLRRRWHGHPIWPCLLASTKAMELRTNWEIYAQEFALALQQSGISAQVQALVVQEDEAALTRFEAKYHASGHALWRVAADVPK
jgi:tRNA (guanine-N7-)-methyltransferase